MTKQTPKFGFFLGRERDPHDVRDHVLRLPSVTREAVGDIDVFTGLTLPVYNQLRIGSCTANAGVLVRRWLAQTFPKYSARDRDLSRLFLYYQERALSGNQKKDSGACTRDICNVIIRTGICPEADNPYIESAFTIPPSAQALADAGAYKGGAYHRVADVDTALSCLAGAQPYAVLLGVTLYPGFEEIGPDGMMPMPKPNEEPIGGHELVIHGYSSQRRAFRFQNSWGPEWGDHGHGWMPEEFLEEQDLSEADMAIIHLGPAWKPLAAAA